MVSCVFKYCRSRKGSPRKGALKLKAPRFFGIPTVITRECDKTFLYSRARRALWLDRINQSRILQQLSVLEEPDVKPHTKVCEKHFSGGQPSKLLDAKSADWAPWCNIGYVIEDPVEENEIKIGELSGQVVVKKKRAPDDDEEPYELQKNDFSTDVNWPMWQQSTSSGPEVKLEVFDDEFVNWVGVPECTSGMESESGLVSVAVQTEVEYSSVGVQTVIKSSSVGVQTESAEDYVLKSEFDRVTRDNVALRAELQNLKQFVMTEKQLSENNGLVKFYTGLPTFAVLKRVLSVVLPNIKQSYRNTLSQFQQFLLVLMRLRLNLLEKDLAFRFGVSQTTISKTCEKWLLPMSECLQQLIPWPDRDSLEQNPTSFKKAFGTRIVVIASCFKVEGVKDNSLCFLIGMTPHGRICFVSKSWCESSETGFLESSGILNKLETGDVLIADKGVDISGCEGMYQPCPSVPICTKGNIELPNEEILSQPTICVRTHAERVNVLVRQRFRILQNPVPLELLANKLWGKELPIDTIVKICCALTYLYPALIEG